MRDKDRCKMKVYIGITLAVEVPLTDNDLKDWRVAEEQTIFEMTQYYFTGRGDCKMIEPPIVVTAPEMSLTELQQVTIKGYND